VLLDCIDPSVTDEHDPLAADAALDMYDAGNGFREPPEPSTYSEEFLARYRAAQKERVARIDRSARAILERQKTAPAGTRASVTDPMITVYRTMANPNYVDLALEPSKRDYGSLLSERPDLMNYSSMGFARTCTARSWLSTWSGISSKADLAANVARIAEPSLFVNAARDREVFPRDARRVFDAMASSDKTFHELDAGHYFEDRADTMMDIVVPWLQERLS
jgi:pimeloyl-ACP methyl ester carboxylesterase